MLEILDQPAAVLPDHEEDDYEFHIEDDARPGFALCGEEVDLDDPPRPMVQGVYDCPTCWKIQEANYGDADGA